MEEYQMNSVSLVGRFAKDPELRYSATGTAICNFTLAVRNPFDKEGNADFIQCVAWGSGAELVAEKHEKGNMIGVDGRIATRNYENNEGQRVYVTEVNVNSIHLIQTKDYAENQNNGNGNGNGNKNNGNGNGNKNNGSNGNGNKSSGSNRNNGSGNRSNRQNA
jgi:single-strand DNA-binding protein